MKRVVLNEKELQRLQSGESIDSILSSRVRRSSRARARELSSHIGTAIQSMSNLDDEGKEWLLKAWKEYCSRGGVKAKVETTIETTEEVKEEVQTDRNIGEENFYKLLREFLQIAAKAKQFNPETKLPRGIYPEELRQKVGDTFTNWLIQNHYISCNKGKQVWFAYTNKKWPGQTIPKLYSLLWEYENL